MINRGCNWISAVPENSKNLFFRTGLFNKMLNETYNAVDGHAFGDYVMTVQFKMQC